MHMYTHTHIHNQERSTMQMIFIGTGAKLVLETLGGPTSVSLFHKSKHPLSKVPTMCRKCDVDMVMTETHKVSALLS